MTDIVRQRKEGEPKIVSNGEPTIHSEGRIGAIVHYPVLVDQGNGYVEKTFERFVRPPGTRIIARRGDSIYLQKEARVEHDGAFDWRVPGGKVVNSFAAYKKYFGEKIPDDVIFKAAALELHEEAHLKASSWSLLQKSACGATVEWDLYYVLAEDVTEELSDHDEGEEIEEGGWYSFEEVERMCKSGEISEGRTVSALLQYMNQ